MGSVVWDGEDAHLSRRGPTCRSPSGPGQLGRGASHARTHSTWPSESSETCDNEGRVDAFPSHMVTSDQPWTLHMSCC